MNTPEHRVANARNSLRFYLTLKLQLKAEIRSQWKDIYVFKSQDGELKIIKAYVELISSFLIY